MQKMKFRFFKHRKQAMTEVKWEDDMQIFCMEEWQRKALKEIGVKAEISLLNPHGGVSDPVGADLNTYRLTRDEIKHLVENALLKTLEVNFN